MTPEENTTLAELMEFQKEFWTQFINKTFPGMDSANTTDINSFDWMLILLNQKEPGKLKSLLYFIEKMSESSFTYSHHSKIYLILGIRAFFVLESPTD